MKKLLFLLLLLFLITGCQKPSEIIDNQKNEEYQTSVFKVVDYCVYQLEDNINSFAIVRVRIKDNKNVNYLLSDIKTNENISLDKSIDYQNELVKKGYNLEKMNISVDLASAYKSAIFNLFVPIVDNKQSEITLTFLNKYQAVIDLNKNQKLLNNEDYEQTIDDINYQIIVKSAYNTLGEVIYKDNEVYDFYSSSEIFAVKIIIISLNGEEIEINDAIFISNNDSIKALDSSYRTERTNNILNSKTKTQVEGYLLFDIINPDKIDDFYSGSIELTVNNKKVKVDIQL